MTGCEKALRSRLEPFRKDCLFTCICGKTRLLEEVQVWLLAVKWHERVRT